MNSYQDENIIMTDQQIIHNNVAYMPQPNNYPPPLPMPSNEQQIMMNQGNFEIPTQHLPPSAIGIKQEGREMYEEKIQQPPLPLNQPLVQPPPPIDNGNHYMEPTQDENDELNESIEEEDEVDEINDADDDEEEVNNQAIIPGINGYNNGVMNVHNNGNLNMYNNSMSHHPQQPSPQQPYQPSLFEPIVETVEYSYPIEQLQQHNQPQPHEPTVERHIVNLPPQPIVEESNSPGRLQIDEGNNPLFNKVHQEFSAEEESEIEDEELEDGGDLDRKLNKFESMEMNNGIMNSTKEFNGNSSMIDHWMSKIDRNTRTCPLCSNNKTMSSMNNVLRHIKEVHGKDNPRLCEQVTQIRHRLARKYTPRQNTDKVSELDDGSADMLKSIYNPATGQCNGCGQTLAPSVDWKQHLLEVHKIQPANSNPDQYIQNDNTQLQPIPITPLSTLNSNQNMNNQHVLNINSGMQVMVPPPNHTQNPSMMSKGEKKPYCNLCNSYIRFDNFTRHLRQKHGCGEEEINKIYADNQMKRIKRKDATTNGTGFDIQQQNNGNLRKMYSPFNGDEKENQQAPSNIYTQNPKTNMVNNNYETQVIQNISNGFDVGINNMRGNDDMNDFQDVVEDMNNVVPFANNIGVNQNGEAVEIRENPNWEKDLIKTIRDRKFECALCVKQLTDRRNLINHVRNVHKKDCTNIERTIGPRLHVRSTTAIRKGKDDGKFAERVLGPRFKQMEQYPDQQQRILEPIRINQSGNKDIDSEDSDLGRNEKSMGTVNGAPQGQKRNENTRHGEQPSYPINPVAVTKKVTSLSQDQDSRNGVIQKVFVCPICNTKFRRDPRKIVDHLFDTHAMQPVELIQRNLKIGIRQCRRTPAA